MLRVTVGVEAHTHDFIATAHEDQKFGLSLADGTAARAARLVAESEHLRLDGLHSHIGSQIFDISGFQVAAARVLAFRAEIMGEHGIDLPDVDLGGGFGIRYTSQDTPIPVAEMADGARRRRGQGMPRSGNERPRISIEPGRAIVSPAVFTLYEVGTVKQVSTDSGIRTYVAVDGGMSDNIRTALYDADYSCTLANRELERGTGDRARRGQALRIRRHHRPGRVHGRRRHRRRPRRRSLHRRVLPPAWPATTTTCPGRECSPSRPIELSGS
jgi:diaminopimelate decarboxylase